MKTLTYDSPVGPLTLYSDGAALIALQMDAQKHLRAFDAARGSDRVLDLARRELDSYFAGRLTRFETPVAPQGTDFQRRVWAALQRIPFGATRAYRDIAAAIGAPAAVRAVGAANGRNPVGIVIPCHRVVGASGALTGYAGGVDRKRFLLALEAGHEAKRCA